MASSKVVIEAIENLKTQCSPDTNRFILAGFPVGKSAGCEKATTVTKGKKTIARKTFASMPRACSRPDSASGA